MKPYWPVDMQYPITQRFGENVKSYPKRQGHPGTDFGLPTLNNLYAVWGAKVKFAGYRPTSGYGREVD
jgi:murein DD-endopeptidase MepM/ murein hydrolase activator NlpD